MAKLEEEIDKHLLDKNNETTNRMYNDIDLQRTRFTGPKKLIMLENKKVNI